MKTLGVVGLGYVGLPLAVQATEKGYSVIGVDTNSSLVDTVNSRKSPYINDDRFAEAISKIPPDTLKVSSSYGDLSNVENIVICVPTPTDNNVPDLSYVEKSAEQVASVLRPGQFVSLESTVNPGVTREVVLSVLENSSGLKVGIDFNLAHCPERIDPGNTKYFVGNLNRVVGGITSDCTKRAFDFYSSVIDAKIIALGSAEEAEFVKSWENSHRNVMIALANSAAIICDALDMDISRVLLGLQSKVDQFGLSLARPGIGPGGHCIPDDIHYVIKRARQSGIDTRFLDDAADLNDKMPRYAVQKLTNMIHDKGEDISQLSIALLGLAYKPDIADFRRSPSIEVGYQLVRVSKNLIIHDPYVLDHPQVVKGASVIEDLDIVLDNADAIFIGTGHSYYKDMLTVDKLKEKGIRFILDGRNCLEGNDFRSSDIYYKGIGR